MKKQCTVVFTLISGVLGVWLPVRQHKPSPHLNTGERYILSLPPQNNKYLTQRHGVHGDHGGIQERKTAHSGCL
jgi:hypothetical protein